MDDKFVSAYNPSFVLAILLRLFFAVVAICLLWRHMAELDKIRDIVVVSIDEDWRVLDSYLGGSDMINDYAFFRREAQMLSAGGREAQGELYYVGEDYPKTLKIPMISGANQINDGAIISRSVAIELFSNTQCLGSRVMIGEMEYEITGVYDDRTPFLHNMFKTDRYPVIILGDDFFNYCVVGINPELSEIFYNTGNESIGSGFTFHNISLYAGLGVFIAKLAFFVIALMAMRLVWKVLANYIKAIGVLWGFPFFAFAAGLLFYIIVLQDITIPAAFFTNGDLLAGILDFFISQNQKDTAPALYHYHLGANGVYLSIVLGLLSIMGTKALVVAANGKL